MPIYEYVCRKCKECFEYMIFSSNDSKTISCPSCGSHDVEKIMSVFSCRGGDIRGSASAESMGTCGSSGGFS